MPHYATQINHQSPPRQRLHTPPRSIATLTGGSALLAVALMIAPGALAGLPGGRPADLPAATQQAFIDYWRTGARQLTPELGALVDYWQRFHLAKAGIGIALVIALVLLTVAVTQRFLNSEGTRLRCAAGFCAVLGAGGATAGAITLVAANIQGAVAPLSSLLTFVSAGHADPTLSPTIDQLVTDLTNYHQPGHPSAPTALLVADFARYHLAFASVSAVLTLLALLGALAAVRQMRRAKGSRRRRRVAGVGAVTALTVTACGALVCAANISSAADSAPALLLAFTG